MKRCMFLIAATLISSFLWAQGPVTIVTPNGGEHWVAGCQGLIQWTTSNTTGPVRIDLIRNNANALVIANQVPAGVTSFQWIVPFNIVPDSTYKVKVTSLTSTAAFDLSDNFFTISPGFLHVNSPNGGEAWVKGTNHPILWNDNLCNNVRIELWKAGLFHSVIAQSVPSNGTFNWLIPNTNNLIPGNDYRIKIISLSNTSGTTGMVYDISDNNFEIVAPGGGNPLILLQPNGGENWIVGCPQIIQWVSSAVPAYPVKLELFRDSVFYMVIAQQVPAGMNSFTWIPPYTILPGNNFRVKVSTLSAVPMFDFSNGFFSIQRGNITVVSPNGGENWLKGSTHVIHWTDNICENVRIELWKGGAIHSVVAQSVPSTGSFTWTIPVSNSLLPGSDYRIRILGAVNTTSTVPLVFDFSDTTFTVAQPSGGLTVVQPNGGEQWVAGCVQPIKWITTAATLNPVKIELFRNGIFYKTICASTPPGQSQFNWIPPSTVIPGNMYKVKVSAVSNPAVFDFSDSTFSITHGHIAVISPNGGENWVKGTMHPILWNDNLCQNVRIELWKGGVFSQVIAQSVPSTGNFQWNIPNVNTLIPASDYKIKILSATGNTGTTALVSDFSDSTFTISAPQGSPVVVVQPNGGELWITGCQAQIQWITTAAVTVPVRIELYRNNQYYLTICQQTPPGALSYSWIPPYSVLPGNNFKVRVICLNSAGSFDFSDNYFAIGTGTISITSPNGGETWMKGTTHPVTWNDNVCENVRIELWKGNGMHSVIAAQVPSTGTFMWAIPNTPNFPPASDYRIKVIAIRPVTNTTVPLFDFSDSTFTLAPVLSDGPAGTVLEKVYPNPCSDYARVILQGKIDGFIEVQILELTGNMKSATRFDELPANGVLEVSTTDLPNGTYLLIVRGESGLLGRKGIMVSH